VTRRALRAAGGAALCLAVTAAACGADAGPPAAPSTAIRITARDFAFDPSTATVPPDTTVVVTLVDTGRVEHSFTADSVHATGDADAGGDVNTISFTAPSAGDIAFHCRYHPDRMRGTLVVRPGGGGRPPGGGSPGS
jgi:plastocyanin